VDHSAGGGKDPPAGASPRPAFLHRGGSGIPGRATGGRHFPGPSCLHPPGPPRDIPIGVLRSGGSALRMSSSATGASAASVGRPRPGPARRWERSDRAGSPEGRRADRGREPARRAGDGGFSRGRSPLEDNNQARIDRIGGPVDEISMKTLERRPLDASDEWIVENNVTSFIIAGYGVENLYACDTHVPLNLYIVWLTRRGLA